MQAFSKDQPLAREFLDACRRMSGTTILFHSVVAERLGLNPSDHKCLDLVREQGPLTAGRLAELTGLTTGAITGVVDRLERAGFVRRETDQYDRRKVLIAVRVESLQRVGALFSGIAAATAAICQDYTEEQLRLVMDVMKRLADAAQTQALALREAPPSPRGASAPAEGPRSREPRPPSRFEHAGAAPHRAKKKPQKHDR
jgi:DNA-binding MarR family transcriptional regulator